jgi:hypothetical protein
MIYIQYFDSILLIISCKVILATINQGLTALIQKSFAQSYPQDDFQNMGF